MSKQIDPASATSTPTVADQTPVTIVGPDQPWLAGSVSEALAFGQQQVEAAQGKK